MGCTLTNGYVLGDCVVTTGGVYTTYIAGHEKNIIFGKSTGNMIEGYDSTALGGTLTFQEYQQELEIANASETVTIDRATGTRFYEQSVSLTIHYGKSSTENDTIRTTLEELSRGNMLMIVKENSGIHKIYGAENGLRVTTGTGGTGTAFGDLNGVTLTLTGKEPESAAIVDLSTSPTAPIVAFGI